MLLKIKNKIINTAHLVSAEYRPAHEWEDDEYEPSRKVNAPSRLEITMSSIGSRAFSEYEGKIVAACSESDVIRFTGQEADDVWIVLRNQVLICAEDYAEKWRNASDQPLWRSEL